MYNQNYDPSQMEETAKKELEANENTKIDPIIRMEQTCNTKYSVLFNQSTLEPVNYVSFGNDILDYAYSNVKSFKEETGILHDIVSSKNAPEGMKANVLYNTGDTIRDIISTQSILDIITASNSAACAIQKRIINLFNVNKYHKAAANFSTIPDFKNFRRFLENTVDNIIFNILSLSRNKIMRTIDITTEKGSEALFVLIENATARIVNEFSYTIHQYIMAIVYDPFVYPMEKYESRDTLYGHISAMIYNDIVSYSKIVNALLVASVNKMISARNPYYDTADKYSKNTYGGGARVSSSVYRAEEDIDF